MGKNFSRREFLKHGLQGAAGITGLAVLGGAHLLPAKAEENAAETIKPNWTAAADVVIVGGGGAGFCAAIEAGRAGASVIVLEKAAICGGDTALSQGMIQAAGTPEQKELGHCDTDTPEKFAEQQVRYAQGFADEDMIREMCMESPKHVDFLRDLGRVYKQVDIVPPAWEFDTEDSWAARCHWDHDDHGGHFSLIKAEADRMENVTVLTEKPAEHLIVDPAYGVVGVTTKDGCNYRANKAVILATGSFGCNQEMTKRYNRIHYWSQTIADKMKTPALASPNITGDGIRMALEIGAGLSLTDSSVTSNMVETGGVGNGYINDMLGIDYHNEYNSTAIPGRILINTSGQRFVQEDALWGYVDKRVYEEALRCGWSAATEPRIWFIQDEEGRSLDGLTLSMSDDLAAQCKTADTIEALADLIHVPAANLVETVERWNGFCETGKDLDFKRRTDMRPIRHGPFHAYPYSPLDSGTFGGVDTDITTQVKDANGNPIPRLYAAGTIMSGTWCGQFYASCGWAILGTVHWGRKAGKVCAALDSWTTEPVATVGEETQRVVGNGHYKAGTYTATAGGFAGEVPVTLTFSDTEILSAEVGQNGETPTVGGEAIKLLCERIVNRQSADLDVVSGATYTSKAILEAAADCVRQATIE